MTNTNPYETPKYCETPLEGWFEIWAGWVSEGWIRCITSLLIIVPVAWIIGFYGTWLIHTILTYLQVVLT